MNDWQEFIERIENELGNSSSSKSDQKLLLEIAEKAQLWNIPAKNALKAKTSTLRRIVKHGRKAIRKGDKKGLEKLLEMAATMTVADLKIFLDLGDRDQISFTKEVIDGENVYVVKLNEFQLQRIKNTMKMYLEFVEA